MGFCHYFYYYYYYYTSLIPLSLLQSESATLCKRREGLYIYIYIDMIIRTKKARCVLTKPRSYLWREFFWLLQHLRERLPVTKNSSRAPAFLYTHSKQYTCVYMYIRPQIAYNVTCTYFGFGWRIVFDIMDEDLAIVLPPNISCTRHTYA